MRTLPKELSSWYFDFDWDIRAVRTLETPVSLRIQIVRAIGGAFLERVFATGRGIQMLNVVSGLGIVFFGVWGLLH